MIYYKLSRVYYTLIYDTIIVNSQCVDAQICCFLQNYFALYCFSMTYDVKYQKVAKLMTNNF